MSQASQHSDLPRSKPLSRQSVCSVVSLHSGMSHNYYHLPHGSSRLSILPSSTSIFPSVYITSFRMDLPVCLYYHLPHRSSRLSISPSSAWIFPSVYITILRMDLPVCLYYYLLHGSYYLPVPLSFAWICLSAYIPIFRRDLSIVSTFPFFAWIFPFVSITILSIYVSLFRMYFLSTV